VLNDTAQAESFPCERVRDNCRKPQGLSLIANRT
jgi:hypothetical protein